MNKTLETIIESYRNEMTEKLQEFIRIESVVTDDNGGGSLSAPFGVGPKKAMQYIMNLAESKGFSCINYDNMACELNFGEMKADAVGSIGHVDVVPAGAGWTYPPYGGEIHDGRIYGRGAVDDKGPIIAVFYAALALKESGLPLSKNITQIIGCCEEGGSFPCLRHYLENAERIPSCGIVPDSYFPIGFSEKHFVNTKFSMKSVGRIANCGAKKILKTISGGEAINVVPSYAEAVFTDADGNVLETVTEKGIAAHAATPEQGENAVAKLLLELAEQDFEPADVCSAVKQLAKFMCMDTTGAGLGIFEEDETGATTNNMGIINYRDGELSVETNARLPLCIGIDEMADRIKKAISDTDMTFEVTYFIEGFYANPQEEPAKTLIQVYRDETGDFESQPYANGSGSYARIMKDFIPFGMALQNEPLQFHVEDESIAVDRLVEVAKIYAEALYRLAM